MKHPKIIIPLFIGSRLVSQTNDSLPQEMEFGFTHSVYTSWSFQKADYAYFTSPDQKTKKPVNPKERMMQCHYGFSLGMFLWYPVNERLVMKPKVESTFSNIAFKEEQWLYAKSYGLTISNAFVLGLTQADNNGIIYTARNMSCYLASKQPYLLFGPKTTLNKFDKGFREQGYQNEFSMGAMIGFGINYEFHGTNLTKEITYTCETSRQNKFCNESKIMHTISLSINIF